MLSESFHRRRGAVHANVFVERLWRSLKYDLIYLHSWPDGFQLEKGLRQYLYFYNHERKHQALNNCTPAQVYLTTTQQACKRKKKQ